MNMNDLDPSSSLGATLYKEVARRMLAALSAGEWKPGEAIPAEKKLSERFAVSIGTLRKAIDELVAENILIRHQGRGTYVATHSRDAQLFRFFNIVRHDGLKTYPQVELAGFGHLKADKNVADKLAISRGAKLVHFTNVLSLGGLPVIVDELYLPGAMFAGLTEQMLRERPNTLYNLYQTGFGLNVIRIEERLRGGLAGAHHAALLQLAPGAPLLEIHRVAFSFNQQPIEYRVSSVDTVNYEYFASASQ
jgi:GntR family transcriptional regulator